MHDIALFVIAGGLLVFIVMVILSIFFDGPTPGSKEWDLGNDKRWFADNKFCTVCGKANTWNPEGGIQYDAMDGRPYYQEVWGCSVSGHTFNRLILRAQRRDYGDATAP